MTITIEQTRTVDAAEDVRIHAHARDTGTVRVLRITECLTIPPAGAPIYVVRVFGDRITRAGNRARSQSSLASVVYGGGSQLMIDDLPHVLLPHMSGPLALASSTADRLVGLRLLDVTDLAAVSRG